MIKYLGLACCGAVALLVATTEPAAAQAVRVPSIGGIGRIGPIGGFGNIGRPFALFSERGYRPAYFPRGRYYYESGPVYAPQVQTTYSYYPPEPEIANTATIQLHVPDDALVWFDGAATVSRGADRTFSSPSLTPGAEYVYQIRVQWTENGKTVETTRAVTLHAGDRINMTVAK
jgi:uncharacterized protein (TIGR03000 family)